MNYLQRDFESVNGNYQILRLMGPPNLQLTESIFNILKRIDEYLVNNQPTITQNMSKEQNPKDDSGKIVINFNPVINNTNTNTNTNSNSNTNTQSFNFEAFAQALPHLKRELKFVEEELEDKPEPEAKQALEEVKKLQNSTQKIEEEAKNKDETKVKESTFWKRLGNFGKSLGTWGSKYLTPDSIKTLGKTANEVAQLGQVVGIETGFDFSNYGAE